MLSVVTEVWIIPKYCELVYHPEHRTVSQYDNMQWLSIHKLTAWGPTKGSSSLLASSSISPTQPRAQYCANVVSCVWVSKHSEIVRRTFIVLLCWVLLRKLYGSELIPESFAKQYVLNAKWHFLHSTHPDKTWVDHNTDLCEPAQRDSYPVASSFRLAGAYENLPRGKCNGYCQIRAKFRIKSIIAASFSLDLRAEKAHFAMSWRSPYLANCLFVYVCSWRLIETFESSDT